MSVQLLPDKTTVTDTSADLGIAYDSKNTVLPKDSRDHKADETTTNDFAAPAAVDELQNKIRRLKAEMRKLNTELDLIRVRQYIANADYLIETRAAPERALSILQSVRADIEARPAIPNTDTNTLLRDIDYRIVALQQYLAHSPDNTLQPLAILIDQTRNKLQATLNLPTKESMDTEQTEVGWIKKWTTKIYAAGKKLVKIEDPHSRHIEDYRLLLRLLIAAHGAALLSEQEQFYATLNDALKLIDTMSQPPISKLQIESILSLEIIWQPPELPQ